MIDLSTLFSALFGIYFATTIAVSGKFHPFDSTAAAGGDWRAILRLLVAFLLLDLLPFAYLLCVLWYLKASGAVPSLRASVGTLFAGLASFAFYRFFIAAILIPSRQKRGGYFFYSTIVDAPKRIAERAQNHRQPPSETANEPIPKVLIGGLLWFGVCVLAFLRLV